MALQQHIKPEQTVGSDDSRSQGRRVNARGNGIAGVVEMSRVEEQQTQYIEPLNSYRIIVGVEKRSIPQCHSVLEQMNVSWHNHTLKTRRIGENNGVKLWNH